RLRHLQVAVHAPRDGRDQRDPRDVTVLDEEASGIMLGLDEVAIARQLLFVMPVVISHRITSTGSPSESSPAPWITICSPPFRPFFTGITRPRYSPSSTSRACAIDLPPVSSTTNTPNRPAPAGARMIADSGTSG